MRANKLFISVLLFWAVIGNTQAYSFSNRLVRAKEFQTDTEDFRIHQREALPYVEQQVKTNIVHDSFNNLINISGLQIDKNDHKAVHGKGGGEFALPGGVKVPFNFDISIDKKGKRVLYFINGDERFEGGIVQEIGDTIYVNLDLFGNVLALKLHGNKLAGYLRKQDGRGQEIPVTATIGRVERFPTKGALPASDVSGTYSIVFRASDAKEEQAVALFQQNGKKLKGTFLRITGDSRFLEGVVDKDSFHLSSFIGSVPVYFRGKIFKNGTISGEQVGTRTNTPFAGEPNEEAALPDPYRLTYLKNGYTSLDFSFPDIHGKLVSLKDEKYRNKVVIVAISGSWCPNCIDEADFLAPWYKKNHQRGVEVISIHYERLTDTASVRKALQRFKERFDIQYEQVFGGKAEKTVVAASLPALNTFLSFPTTIIIDKKGKVAKIHTGFSGPATGKYYNNFVKEFNEDIVSLLEK